MSDQLSSYFLDSATINYTTRVVLEFLRDDNNTAKRRRAASAIAFFIDILDPSTATEKAQLDIFFKYRAALEDAEAAKTVLDANPGVITSVITADRKQTSEAELTPAQRVLNLPELLDVIFSHISTPTKSTRDTLHAAALTSVSLHHAAQSRLWSHPRDLNTVRQQVCFAFGAAISSAGGEGLGAHVKRLRIRVTKGAWNVRLVTKIVELCPSIIDLTLHWGDTKDGSEEVTPDSVRWLSTILGLLPKLKHLTLAQFSWPDVQSDLIFPKDAHLPFSRLETLDIRGFNWYFDVIAGGLGPSLTSLDIGSDTSRYNPANVVAIAQKLTSLTLLRFAGPLELDQLRLFAETAPGLEIIDIVTFDERDDSYVASVYSIIAGLPAIRGVSLGLSIPAEIAQIIQLAGSSAPFEDLSFYIQDGEEESAVTAALVELIMSKRRTLKSIHAYTEFRICADNRLVQALAACPQLENIGITFDPEKLEISDADVEMLLTHCPRLRIPDELEVLVAGNPLYEARCKEFEKDQAVEEEELAEYILAN